MIIENIKELNALVDEGEQTIVESVNGATFQPHMSEKIRLALYENGICLFNGPFRDFSDPKTQQFCKDIMDGYFPTELQKKYPDGVPFDVADKREVFFKDKHNTVFETKGYRLGTRNDDSAYMMKKVETDLIGWFFFFQLISLLVFFVDNWFIYLETKLTLNQFLKKLPSCVVRNGNITNIRDEIENKLKVY